MFRAGDDGLSWSAWSEQRAEADFRWIRVWIRTPHQAVCQRQAYWSSSERRHGRRIFYVRSEELLSVLFGGGEVGAGLAIYLAILTNSRESFTTVTELRKNIIPHFWQNLLTFYSISDINEYSFCWRVNPCPKAHFDKQPSTGWGFITFLRRKYKEEWNLVLC